MVSEKRPHVNCRTEMAYFLFLEQTNIMISKPGVDQDSEI